MKKNKTIKLLAVFLLAFALMIPMASATVGDLMVTLGKQAVISSTPAIGQVYSAVQLAEQAATLSAAVSGGPASIAALGGQFALSQIKAEGMSAILGSQAASQISQIEGYGKILSEGSGYENIKINKERGFIEEGTMTIKSEDGAEKEINMKNMKFTCDKSKETGTYEFGEDSSLEIGDRKYENVKSGGKIETDKEGNVVSAKITSTDVSEYKFGDNEPITVDSGTEVIFKDGILTINSAKDVEYMGKKINGKFNKININGNEIYGEKLLVGTIETTYPVVIEGKEISGKFSIEEKGFLLHENSNLIDKENNIEVSAEKLKILYADSGAFTKESAKKYEGDIFWQSGNDVIVRSRTDNLEVKFSHNKDIKKDVYIDPKSSVTIDDKKGYLKFVNGQMTDIKDYGEDFEKSPIQVQLDDEMGKVKYKVTTNANGNVDTCKPVKSSNGLTGQVISLITGKALADGDIYKTACKIISVFKPKPKVIDVGDNRVMIDNKYYYVGYMDNEPVYVAEEEVERGVGNQKITPVCAMEDGVNEYGEKYKKGDKIGQIWEGKYTDLRKKPVEKADASKEELIKQHLRELGAKEKLIVDIRRSIGGLISGKAPIDVEVENAIMLGYLSEKEGSLITKAASGKEITMQDLSSLEQGNIANWLEKNDYIIKK